MVSHHLNASRCPNSLLRYELVAARCYHFAEQAAGGGGDLAVLCDIRRHHEAAAARVRGRVVGAGQSPSSDPGIWGVLLTLVETSAAVFGRTAMLTVLLWIEQHAAEAYEASRDDPDPADDPSPASEALPRIRDHVGALEALIEKSRTPAAGPCAGYLPADLLPDRLAGLTPCR